MVINWDKRDSYNCRCVYTCKAFADWLRANFPGMDTPRIVFHFKWSLYLGVGGNCKTRVSFTGDCLPSLKDTEINVATQGEFSPLFILAHEYSHYILYHFQTMQELDSFGHCEAAVDILARHLIGEFNDKCNTSQLSNTNRYYGYSRTPGTLWQSMLQV